MECPSLPENILRQSGTGMRGGEDNTASLLPPSTNPDKILSICNKGKNRKCLSKSGIVILFIGPVLCICASAHDHICTSAEGTLWSCKVMCNIWLGQSIKVSQSASSLVLFRTSTATRLSNVTASVPVDWGLIGSSCMQGGI